MLEENAEDLDRYCGYVPISQSEESTGLCNKSPYALSNLKVYEGRPYLVHSKQPVPKGSPYSLYSLQPMLCNQLPDPSPYRTVSDGGTSSLYTRQPVSKRSSSSRPIRTLLSEESNAHQAMNSIFASESSLPNEYESKFTQNFSNTSVGRELNYTSLSLHSSTASSNSEGFFLKEGNLDGYVFGDNYSNDGEIESEKFENGKVVLGKSNSGNYDKKIRYDNVDDAMGTASYSETESDDTEEEELILIDSDIDDTEIVSELSQKDNKYCEYPVGKSNTVIVSEKDYRSLECNKFLNDIIIDFYLNYIFLQILPAENQLTVHVFSTIFYKRLLQMPKKKRKSANFEEDPAVSMAEKRHRRVSGWTRNVNLFSKSVILIPICENSHWYLLMVIGLSGEAPFILVLDSLGGLRKREARIIRQYLACEYEAKLIIGKRGFSDADIPSIRPVKPQQPNGTDCGVYLLHYAEKIFNNISHFLSPDLPCLKNWFSHEEVSKKRSRIARLIRKMAKEQKSEGDDYQFPDIVFEPDKDSETNMETYMDVEEVKIVDDFINRLDNLTDKVSQESFENSKGNVGSEISESMKTSFCRKRASANRKMNGNIKISSLSTSTSRGLLVPDLNPKTELVPPPKNRKSYSEEYKIPRMKNSESTRTQTAVIPTEPAQSRGHSLSAQASNGGKSGADSITRKHNAKESNFHTHPGISKPEIEILTVTSCPVYGDRCEGIYHLHPKVKNLSRTRRNEVNTTRKSGMTSSNHLHGQYPQNLGLKKSNIVDKLLTDASETSNM